MRSGVVAAGVFMMIIGGALVVFVPRGEQAPFMNIGGVGILLHQVVGAGMAFLGFLLFIAGLAASPSGEKAVSVITIPPAPSPAQPAPKGSEVLVICPECGARVSSKSKFCSECGEKLGPEQGAGSRKAEGKSEAPELEGGKARFCMYCGTELPEDSNFCPECGKGVKRAQ
jgi:predicted amidophosphoribosyltransferase